MSFLTHVQKEKRDEIEKARAALPLKELRARIKDTPKPLGFRSALTSGGFGIIAEIKKQSPSMGPMRSENVEEAPRVYKESAIIKAVSILTDWTHFRMTIQELERLKKEIGKPVLRKDFIIDEYQVVEARAYGADAILLMASLHGKKRLRRLFEIASELGLDVLFECHSTEEIDILPQRAEIVGINSRQFRSGTMSTSRLLGKLLGAIGMRSGMRDLSTDLSAFRDLVHQLPRSVVRVAESGVTPGSISEIRELGFHCALIGTAFLTSPAGVRDTLEAFQKALEIQPSTSAVAVPSAKPLTA